MIALAIAFLVLALIIALIPPAAQLPQRAELPAWVHAGSALLALGAAALAGAAAAQPVPAVQVAVLVIAVAVAAVGGSPVVLGAFSLAHREAARERRSHHRSQQRETRDSDSSVREDPKPTTATEDDSDTPGPLRGGFTIGILERVAVAVSILTAWPQGIAIVMAVKGLARYPELRNPDASEQFIIGTATSVLWAAAASGTAFLIVT
ncbi:hypothetical protein [Hoyosella subflava]|uniref:Uncharacterized protein n=1 Tax=Hoyosella subflava (strain DSM 45089 / JCM 17490 / NBRC 109087 / DQS3-9A1) TaxID=443218 RepID=F6ENA7_HOYSD|nr:hypothetical protein [Hoyosella subflava]AEF40378.1 hypothetical protein AS9A_1929 [Hoyosella subflava DQS3-9A1]